MSAAATEPRLAAADREALTRIRGRLVRPMPDDVVLGWALPLVLGGVALLMRLWRITRPHAKVFDETYYAHDAWNLLHHGVELDSNTHDRTPGFVAHPPLGKWLIALGEAMFGNHPLGWRFAAAVIGSAAVVLIARIARRLFRSTLLGTVAGLLLMLDGLEFVQSRTSMLDIFLMFWVLAAFGCLLLDRDHGRRLLADRLTEPLAPRSFGPWLGPRPWRWLCGLCLGAATATKWDGLYWIPAFLVLAVFWDAGARRVAGCGRPLRAAAVKDGLYALAPFLLLPVVVYVVSWTGWFASDGRHAYDHDRYVHPGQSWWAHDRAVFGGWLRYQWEIYDFHRHLSAAHPYLSRPWGWLLLARPVSYFYAAPHAACGAGNTCAQEVLAIGTPAIWWVAIPALVIALWRMLGRLDWRAAAILVAFAAGYLPWFWADAQHRTMFLFYLLPDVPFMVLALTLAVGLALGSTRTAGLRRTLGTIGAGAYLLAVLANFAYFLPVLSGGVLTYDQWRHRIWLDSCNSNPHRNQHHENAPCWI